ncbi:hypothetical protein [Absidia glauca]|uniref:Protein kinase domain-containing protein n=1 Tax=Absidia glauca TaxID=4829 RepID=A0A168NPJ9_ABSGL|nr:hypothetical protein [Absidia glauca]
MVFLWDIRIVRCFEPVIEFNCIDRIVSTTKIHAIHIALTSVDICMIVTVGFWGENHAPRSLLLDSCKIYRILEPTKFEVAKFHSVYTVGDKLGEGSFAAVYKATRRRCHETPEGSRPTFVAVKSFKKGRFSQNPGLLPSLVEEIGILMSLEVHPCVIKIESVFNEPRYINLVLEYVSGGDLFDLVIKKGQLCESDTRFIFFQLFAGIKFLHERQIAHCDLKPENVLVVDVDTLRVKITDFGLAKTVSSQNPALHDQCGTLAYVAPEVLDPGKNFSKSCDLWSLGVMLYVCLGGVLPFSEETNLSAMKEKILNGKYSYDDECWRPVSDQAKDLMDRLLTVDPITRIGVGDARVRSVSCHC